MLITKARLERKWGILTKNTRFLFCPVTDLLEHSYQDVDACLCTHTHTHTHKLVLCSQCPMRYIITFPPGFPPGLPCLVKADQSRNTNGAHVATQPSSESCLFHDWRDGGCRLPLILGQIKFNNRCLSQSLTQRVLT